MTPSDTGRAVDDIADIRHRFRRYDIRNDPTNQLSDSIYPNVKRASVLVPIFLRNQQWRVLLTIRSQNLKSHTGMVALPGGVRDNSDSDEVDTALREAEEEIGLSRHDVTVLAVFFPNIVRPGYIVFPVVAVIPNSFQPRANPDEVASVFDLPLDTFLRDFNIQSWTMFGVDLKLFHFPRTVNNVELDVWGFTASICMDTANIVYNTGTVIDRLRPWNEDNDDCRQARFLFHFLCQRLMSYPVIPVDVLRRRFQKLDVRETTGDKYCRMLYPNLHRASVLIPIFSKNGRWHVLLTIRSQMLNVHTGHVAFPGGLRDQSDSDEVDTALREAEEEIGLSRHDVTVLAVFQPTFVLPHFIVFPVVGVIPESFVPKPNPGEISTVFDLPLDKFLRKADKQMWVAFGMEFPTPLFHSVVDNVKIHIWGFTALNCLCTAYGVYDVAKEHLQDKRTFGIYGDVLAQLRFAFHHFCQNVNSRL